MTQLHISSRGIFEGTVTHRRTLCDEHFELSIAVDHFPDAGPGQFVQLLCADSSSPATSSPATANGYEGSAMLRRPFSIGGLNRANNAAELTLMGRVVGPGTAWLDRRKSGDHVNILGPLGRPFSVPPSSHHALLIAGGIGLPPIRWHAEFLRKNAMSCHAIFGARERRFVPLTITNSPSTMGDMTSCADEFGSLGVPLAITTDDGSLGLRGRVTDAMERFLTSHSTPTNVRVYACGPEPMLRAVAALAVSRRIPCELAMERVMACGMGTCQSCVVPIVDTSRELGWRYALCCTEGPVFSADIVKWD